MTALILGALGAVCGWHIGAAFMRTGEASLLRCARSTPRNSGQTGASDMRYAAIDAFTFLRGKLACMAISAMMRLNLDLTTRGWSFMLAILPYAGDYWFWDDPYVAENRWQERSRRSPGNRRKWSSITPIK